jgi:putative Mn2+ efflux pump MntP
VDLLSIVLIGIGVSMDCLAVAIAGSISMRTLTRLQILRASLSFGLFQMLMLILGWLLGQTVVDLIESFDHWLAFGLLLLIGARMIKESLESEEDDDESTDITRGLALLTLSVATSIDSLAVGLSLAFLGSSVPLAAPVIGSITFAFSVAGFYIGRPAGSVLGRRAEAVGGIVLIGIGLRILLTHLL